MKPVGEQLDTLGLKPLTYRQIWTVGDLDHDWLKESVKDSLFDADAHKIQQNTIKERWDNG
jgi:hypothetical protein